MERGVRREQGGPGEQPAAARPRTPEPATPGGGPSHPPGGPSTARALALQRTAGNRAATTVMRQDAPGAVPAGAAESQTAAADVLALERAIADAAASHRRWLAGNWREFFGYTSSNPRLSWTADMVDAVMSNAIGNATADAAQGWLAQRAAGTGAGAAVAARLGSRAVGFVVAVLIETAVGLVYDAVRNSTDQDDASAEASRQTARLIGDQEAALDEQEAQAVAEGRRRTDELRVRLAATTDPAELEALRASVRTEAERLATCFQESDRTLLTSLLRDWVREHAADPDDADSSTSEAQWTAASARAFGAGGGLANHPEVFAYQSRARWTALGLSVAEPQHWIEQVMGEPPLGAEQVEQTYGRRVVTWRSTTDPEALAGFLRDHNLGRALTATGLRLLRDGHFRLTCELGLGREDGAVYVDEWSYALELLTDEWDLWEPGPGENLPRSPAAGLGRALRELYETNRESLDFTVSPD